jgi:hypothetical protein
VAELDEALKIMVHLQVGLELGPAQLRQLRAFMESLTGQLDPAVAGEIEKMERKGS